jgi:GTP1/Obg family GTP-binding protein
VHHWRETKDCALTGRIPAIVKELERAVVDVARLIEEGQRQAELEHQRWEAQQAIWERERAERRAAEALKESKEELLQIIARWAEAKSLDQFFADAERRVADLDADERLRMLDRLKSARELIGSVDALERLRSWKSPEER